MSTNYICFHGEIRKIFVDTLAYLDCVLEININIIMYISNYSIYPKCPLDRQACTNTADPPHRIAKIGSTCFANQSVPFGHYPVVQWAGNNFRISMVRN